MIGKLGTNIPEFSEIVVLLESISKIPDVDKYPTNIVMDIAQATVKYYGNWITKKYDLIPKKDI